MRSDVTIVIAPKDWYSQAVDQLRCVLQSSSVSSIIYLVSPPHPPALEEELAQACRVHPHLRVLRMEEALVNPYAMRQAALDQVTTTYAVFLGNDTFPHPGWLEALVAAAEDEPTALAVQPLILERSVTHDDSLHVWWHPPRLLHLPSDTSSGADAGCGDGSYAFVPRFDNEMVTRQQADCQRALGRQSLDFLEDHAVLVRTAAFARPAAPLWDPRACHRREFFDLAWSVAAAGGKCLLAPNAVVTYRKVRPLLPSDLPLFVARRHDEASVLSYGAPSLPPAPAPRPRPTRAPPSHSLARPRPALAPSRGLTRGGGLPLTSQSTWTPSGASAAPRTAGTRATATKR